MKAHSLAASLCVLLVCCSLAPAVTPEINEAAEKGDCDKLKVLLKADPSLARSADTNRVTPLHVAARNDQASCVELLLNAGSDLDARNDDEHTPLFCALHSGALASARVLLERGAKLSGVDRWKYDVRAMALRSGKVEALEMLSEKGLKWDGSIGPEGTPVLCAAASDGDPAIIEYVLKHGGDLNVTDAKGNAPLHYAASHGQIRAARKLLESGADPSRKNLVGFRPFDLVKGRENDALADLLQVAAKPEGSNPDRKLNQFGDPMNIAFEGNAAFSEDQIRKALKSSTSFLLASHPQAQLQPFLEILATKIRAGYLAAGYPDAQTRAVFDTDKERIKVSVVEGQRFIADKVVVSGVSRAIQKRIANRLTQYQGSEVKPLFEESVFSKQIVTGDAETTLKVSGNIGFGSVSSSPSPIWLQGHPARCDAQSSGAMEGIIRAALVEEGFLFPKIRLSRRPSKSPGSLDLLVDVEPGSRETITAIEVRGNQKHSRAEILSYLGLKSGLLAKRELFETIDRKLTSSGRFIAHKQSVEKTRADDGSTGLLLKLELEELEEAPKLTEKLSDVQVACLKVAAWVNSLQGSSEEFVLNLSSDKATGRAIFAPGSGVYLSGRFRGNEKTYAAIMKQNKMAFLTPGGVSSFRDEDLFIEAFLHLVPVERAAGDSNRWNMMAGVHFSHQSGEKNDTTAKAPFIFNVFVSPSAVMGNATKNNCRITNGVLVMGDGTNSCLKANARTGRILSFENRDESGVKILSFEKGAFARAEKEWELSAAKMEGKGNQNGTVGSLALLFCRELIRSATFGPFQGGSATAERENAAQAFESVFGSGLLKPLDQFFEDDGKSTFWIPMDEMDTALAGNNVASLFSGMVFRLSDALFPRDSWPWTLARESVFLLTCEGKYTGAEMRRLYEAPQTGPVGCLAVARSLDLMGATGSRAFAIRGLARLSAYDFKEDCKLLLDGDSGMAKFIAQIAENLRKADKAQVESLAAMLSSGERAFLLEAYEALQKQTTAPLSVQLEPALEKYWNSSLRARVRGLLQNLMSPPASPQRANPT